MLPLWVHWWAPFRCEGPFTAATRQSPVGAFVCGVPKGWPCRAWHESRRSVTRSPPGSSGAPRAAPEVGRLKGAAWSWPRPEGGPDAQAGPEPLRRGEPSTCRLRPQPAPRPQHLQSPRSAVGGSPLQTGGLGRLLGGPRLADLRVFLPLPRGVWAPSNVGSSRFARGGAQPLMCRV